MKTGLPESGTGTLSPDVLAANIEMSTLKRHVAVRHGLLVAVLRYAPVPIPVKLQLFYAADERRPDPSLGWQEIAGGRLEMTPVSGTHWSMVDTPHVGSLGAAISAAIEKVPD